MLERTKARLGIGGRKRRYVDIEEVADLEEIADPETLEDDTASSLRELAAEHIYLTVALSLLATVATGLFVVWGAKFIPAIVGNKWVQLGGVLALVGGLSYRTGWKKRRSIAEDIDELNAEIAGEATSYQGTYVDLPGKAVGFVPIKGYRRAGHSPRPYKVGELSAAMVERRAHRGAHEDEPAIIRLEPNETVVTETERGVRVVTRSGGIEPDPDGNHTNLHATLPDYDDEEMREFAEDLRELKEDNSQWRSTAKKWKSKYYDLLEDMDEPVEDRVESILGHVKELQHVSNGRTGSQSSGLGPIPADEPAGSGQMGGDQELQDVDDEVSPDDD